MPQIIPIKELKNTTNISELCNKSNEPIYITKNGYGDMVIMSIRVFEEVTERTKMYESLAVSERQIKEGKVREGKKSLSDIKEKYGL